MTLLDHSTSSDEHQCVPTLVTSGSLGTLLGFAEFIFIDLQDIIIIIHYYNSIWNPQQLKK